MSILPLQPNPDTFPGVLCHFSWPHSSNFFVVHGCALQHHSELQYSECMDWLPRYNMWTCTRKLLSINVSHTYSISPLCRNHCSENTEEFHIFETFTCHRCLKLASRFNSDLSVDSAHSVITQALGNYAKRIIKTITSALLSKVPKLVYLHLQM